VFLLVSSCCSFLFLLFSAFVGLCSLLRHTITSWPEARLGNSVGELGWLTQRTNCIVRSRDGPWIGAIHRSSVEDYIEGPFPRPDRSSTLNSIDYFHSQVIGL